MYPIERKQAILELVNKEKSVSVAMLSKKLYICEATIRRDLTELEKLGQLKRTHGGAISIHTLGLEAPIDIRKTEQIQSKVQIAKIAAEFIKSGMTLFIDGSSTCLRLLLHISKLAPITVITNGSRTAAETAKYNDINLIMLGGKLNHTSGIFEGSLTQSAINNFYADIFFFSAKGIDIKNGLTESFYESAVVKKKMLERSKIKILLADSTKFNGVSFAKIADLTSIDYIITDKKQDTAFQEYLRANNIKFLC